MINEMGNSIKIPHRCQERFLPLRSTLGHALVKAGVNHAGLSRLTPGYRIARSRPHRFVLIATCEGQGYFSDGINELPLRPNSLVIAPPVLAHCYGVRGKSWRTAWFYFENSHPWQGWLPERVVLHEGVMISALEHAMNGLLGLVKQESIPMTASNAGALYCEIILGLLRQILNDVNGTPAPAHREIRGQLRELWQGVREAPQLDWSVERLARRMCVSVPTFHRLTLSHEGIAPWRMVIRLRMDIASQLLGGTDYPISVVASRVGYKDAYTFSAAFKNHFGISPSTWRKNHPQ